MFSKKHFLWKNIEISKQVLLFTDFLIEVFYSKAASKMLIFDMFLL